MTLMTCPYCGGTGQIAQDACCYVSTKGQRCLSPKRVDPIYFENFPEREYARGYCVRHGNELVRAHLEWERQARP
jgi:hypothetical protein